MFACLFLCGHWGVLTNEKRFHQLMEEFLKRNFWMIEHPLLVFVRTKSELSPWIVLHKFSRFKVIWHCFAWVRSLLLASSTSYLSPTQTVNSLSKATSSVLQSQWHKWQQVTKSENINLLLRPAWPETQITQI